MDVSQIIDQALEHHQKCMPYTPSKEDSLRFHVVFYELISLRDDEDLKDEIWKHGKLHSDHIRKRSRRLRESACTVSRKSGTPADRSRD
jgi:DNA-binding FadR family transcriptional regulator